MAVEGSLFLMLFAMIVGINQVLPAARALLELGVAGALGVFALSALIEAVAAMAPTPAPPMVSDDRRPRLTSIIAAYLPNEAPVLLATIDEHLSDPDASLELIVAYNTPTPMGIETDLALRAASDPRLTVLPVTSSRSKAENIAAALAVASGGVIGLFDADHRPDPKGFDRAWRWIDAGADVVQGRCTVRAPDVATRAGSMLSLVVATEFEQMYGVGHPGRARVQGFGLFGGSNGYWRADVLRATSFDPTALTEDIDASVRLLKAGGRIVVDPHIASTELAPPTLGAFCHQRLRWSQGWVQVSRRHLGELLRHPMLSRRQKAGAGWLFGFGVAMPWLATFTLPFMAFNAATGGTSPWRPEIGALVSLGTVSFVSYTLVAYRHAQPGARRLRVFGLFVLANLIFYAHLRVALVRLGHLHEWAGKTEWRVTPRS